MAVWMEFLWWSLLLLTDLRRPLAALLFKSPTQGGTMSTAFVLLCVRCSTIVSKLIPTVDTSISFQGDCNFFSETAPNTLVQI